MPEKKISADQARMEIISKIEEIYSIFKQIDCPERTCLSIRICDEYESCDLYYRDKETYDDIFACYVYPEEGFSKNWYK